VRAGLELVAAVGGLKTRAPLQTRVGIATGLVVVGDLIGSGASQEQAIVGETPNLAARLQGIAEPNEVVIAEDTRRLSTLDAWVISPLSMSQARVASESSEA
jgi:class 3 adenylate cyclase